MEVIFEGEYLHEKIEWGGGKNVSKDSLFALNAIEASDRPCMARERVKIGVKKARQTVLFRFHS